jgi:DTW domain-containing protein
VPDHPPRGLPTFREPRAHCYRCDKPARMCLCSLLTPIPNRVGVHVLQHPSERRHAVGTARLLRLGLASVDVHVLALRGTSSASPPVALPPGAGLLYPCAPDQELSTLAPEDQPQHLVVIDGTWAQAHRIFRANPWVAALPRYRLSPDRGSNYRIRKEPRQECLSTVETVVAALRILEPGLEGTDALLTAFDAMIDAQITAAAEGPGRPAGKRARKRAPRHVPETLASSELVVVVVEVAARTPGRDGPRSALRVSAVSLDGARVFDRVVQVHPAPDAQLLARTGLDQGSLDTAVPEAQAASELRAWLGARHSEQPTALACWDPSTRGWLQRHAGDHESVLLKGVWANLSRRRIGALDTVVQALDLPIADLPLRGRARARLSQAHAMAVHILGPSSPDGVAPEPGTTEP